MLPVVTPEHDGGQKYDFADFAEIVRFQHSALDIISKPAGAAFTSLWPFLVTVLLFGILLSPSRDILPRHGHGATDVVRKAPMRIEILLHARDSCVDKEIADRIVDWSAPFWTCIWAVLMTLWYMGARVPKMMATPRAR
jgi:hypothetical protein